MPPRLTRRRFAASAMGLVAGATIAPRRAIAAAARRPQPGQVLPMESIAPEHRESVADVIADHTIHRKGSADAFPCHSPVYLGLVNQPAITLALWQDLATSPVRLRQVSPGKYEGSDGAGASATWEFVHRSPKLHGLLAHLDYTSPRGNAHLQGRIVLVVHSGYYREVNGEPYVQHDVEAFVKVDSKGWKALARTVRPILEKVLEEQVHEAGLFVSLMGRLVETYPNWACQVALTKSLAPADAKDEFRKAVIQNRRKGAFAGRPTLVNETPSATSPTSRRS